MSPSSENPVYNYLGQISSQKITSVRFSYTTPKSVRQIGISEIKWQESGGKCLLLTLDNTSRHLWRQIALIFLTMASETRLNKRLISRCYLCTSFFLFVQLFVWILRLCRVIIFRVKLCFYHNNWLDYTAFAFNCWLNRDHVNKI